MESTNFELRTHNLFIPTNDTKPLIDFKRGIIPEDDEYRLRGGARKGVLDF